MSRLNRILGTRREMEHSSQESPGHKRDKLEGEIRNSEEWVLMPREDGLGLKDDIVTLPGSDFIIRDGKMIRVASPEYVAYLAEEKRRRGRYVGTKRRGSKLTQCSLKCLSPIFEMTLTPSPWLGEKLAEIAATDPERVSKIMEELAAEMIPHIERLTGCVVLGLSTHYDTGIMKGHPNFVLSHIVEELGVMRMKPKLARRAGPWMASVDRQRRSGLLYRPHDERFERAMARFRERYPDSEMPDDIALFRLFDDLAEALLGSLRILKGAYRDRIERARASALMKRKADLLAQIRALDSTGISLQQNEPKNEKYHGKN